MNDRLFPARPILAVSAAVFRKGRVLIVRRALMPLLGHFSLPGARVEVGETMAAALARKLMEEIGVEGEIIAFNRQGSDFPRSEPNTNAFCHCVVRRPLDKERAASEGRGRRRRLDRSGGRLPSPTTPELGEISCARGADRRSDRNRRKMTVDIQPDVAKGGDFRLIAMQ